MRQRAHLSFILSFLLVTGFYGCKKADNGGTFTVKGQWLEDCSGAAHAGERLEISLVRYGINTKETFENVGSGMTDAEGRFSIICENHGNAELLIKATQGGVGNLNVLGGDGKVDDLGILYDQYSAAATLKFVFAQAHADTFFVTDGITRDTFSFYPAAGTQVINLSKTRYHERTNRIFQGHYGLGRADFTKPVNSGDSRLLLVYDAYRICGSGDATVINIP